MSTGTLTAYRCDDRRHAHTGRRTVGARTWFGDVSGEGCEVPMQPKAIQSVRLCELCFFVELAIHSAQICIALMAISSLWLHTITTIIILYYYSIKLTDDRLQWFPLLVTLFLVRNNDCWRYMHWRPVALNLHWKSFCFCLLQKPCSSRFIEASI